MSITNIFKFKEYSQFSKLLIYGLMIVTISSCNKSDYLDQKPRSALVIPTTIDDYQAILDASGSGSGDMNSSTGMGDASSDNYYATTNYLLSASPQILNVYTWASDIYVGAGNISDWNIPYLQVFNANVVLDGIGSLKQTSSASTTLDNLKGSALFFRALAFYNLSQLFAPVYDSVTANSDLGIPLRLSSDINIKSIRASVQETYDQIITDAKNSCLLLNKTVQINSRNRPSLPAAYALLSRVYLSARNYRLAGLYADSCLQVYSKLNDFNQIKAGTGTANYNPYTISNNDEVIFSAGQKSSTQSLAINLLGSSIGSLGVDTILYRQYSGNDLRKNIFYYVANGSTTVNLNGGYSGNNSAFGGFGVNEMILARAECFARSGNTASAMSDLNLLLGTRWKTGTYVKYTAISSSDALNQILSERRKELPFSGVRWTDLRRLNKEGANITIKHIVNGQVYSLLPNDPKYVLPIPPDVLALSGIQQNPR